MRINYPIPSHLTIFDLIYFFVRYTFFFFLFFNSDILIFNRACVNCIYVYFATRVNEWSSDLLMIDLLLDGVYHSRNDWIGIYVYIDLFLVEFFFKNSCINFSLIFIIDFEFHELVLISSLDLCFRWFF